MVLNASNLFLAMTIHLNQLGIKMPLNPNHPSLEFLLSYLSCFSWRHVSFHRNLDYNIICASENQIQTKVSCSL